MVKYDELSRKKKQLIASEYPYKSDNQLFDTTLGNSFESRKSFASRQEIIDFKEEAAKEDVSLQKRRDFVTGSMRPVNSETISIIDAVLGPMGEDSYRAALEIASHELDPLTIVQDLIGIQTIRLRKGMEYEDDAELGLNQETEAAMSNMINLAKLNNEIINGKKMDVQIEGSLSSMILGMDIEDDDEQYIDIDIRDDENEKQ
jgi:hypothetical protein